MEEKWVFYKFGSGKDKVQISRGEDVADIREKIKHRLGLTIPSINLVLDIEGRSLDPEEKIESLDLENKCINVTAPPQIPSQQQVTIQSQLSRPLPSIVITVGAHSSSSQNKPRFAPNTIKHWDDFFPNAQNYLFTLNGICDPFKLEPPNRSYGAELEMYDLFVTHVNANLDLLTDTTKVLFGKVLGGQIGSPDFECYTQKTIGSPPTVIYPVEVKFPLTLILYEDISPGSYDLNERFANKSERGMKNKNIKRSVCQLWSYMKSNKCRYGVLTTYTRSWFFMRDKENVLYISPALSFDSQSPSLLLCFVYLASLALENQGSPAPNLSSQGYASDEEKKSSNFCKKCASGCVNNKCSCFKALRKCTPDCGCVNCKNHN